MRAFIIFRDRVSYARRCIVPLLAAGLEVIVVDHGTTYPPAVAWLAHLKKTGIEVIDIGPGHHPRALWNHAWFRRMCAQERYIVTDPDVILSEGCPADWVKHFDDILDRFPSYHKVGPGLRIDRIPLHYSRRNNVVRWEQHFWEVPMGDSDCGIYHADIDTTLALHVPIMQMGAHSFHGLRTGFPYVSDHVAWYENLGDLTEEQAYYHEHAEPGITFWTLPGRGAGDRQD